MAVIRAQVSFEATSGAAEDIVTNTFHFEGDDSFGTTGNVLDMVEDFYTSDYGEGPIIGFFPGSRFSGDMRIRLYSLDDPEPRPPINERLVEFAPSGAAALPNEVALVMTYGATPVAGINRGRLRGRIYLGPIIAGANAADGRPGNAVVNAVNEAGHELALAADASVNFNWVVWSRAGSAFYVVTGVRVDNEWDTQRRRGLRGTERASGGAGGLVPIT